MRIDFLTVIRLVCATLLPVVTAVILCVAERKTKFGKTKYWFKQLVTGLLFGTIAVLATEIGIEVDGAVLNVRNAAPLTAGLAFGGPAGIIAGVIGGIYRWIAIYWGAGEFSRLACSLAVVLAGLFGAVCRKFMFENKTASGLSGLAIGGTTEVLHMLLLFLTNMSDIYTAFQIVAKCAPLMILCNSLSVMLALLSVSFIENEGLRKTCNSRQLSRIFQFLLLICVIVSFAATCLFTNSLQTHIAYANAKSLLELNLKDVEKDVREASDENLLNITQSVAEDITASTTREELATLAKRYNVAGINIIDDNGIIKESTIAEFVGFDMANGEQSAEFLCLLSGTDTFVQSYQPLSGNSAISRKYAGVALPNGGFVQVGYNAEQFRNEMSDRVRSAVKNRHIGKEGGIIVCDEKLTIISDNSGHEGETAINAGNIKGIRAKSGTCFTTTVRGTKSYCMYIVSEGFYLIAMLPISEAMFLRNIAVTVLAFIEVLVFAALFVHIYLLLKHLIVDNIHKINGSLSQITDGNLNVHIDVRGNEEFASLSDDINATVETLKRYIAEAESRIDSELEFARQIQQSALPSVFPPYPDRKDFSIFASMDAAKEVGGDFYDFYLTDTSHLMFIVADVSGKGIPGALFMMRAKTLIKKLSESGRSVDEVFTQANSALCENNDAEMFVTAWMGMIDLKSGVLQYVSAGHNPPLIRRADGEFEYLRTRPNFVLAGMEGIKYNMHELQLYQGDEIFLYTDGVTEAANKDAKLYGEERLASTLSKTAKDPQLLCAAVRADIDTFVGDAEQSDDITMLCVKFGSNQNEYDFFTVPNKASAESVMSFIREKLELWEISTEVSNKAQVTADEIYSNIVNYSGAKNAKLTVLKRDDKLTLVFEDDGVPYDPTATKEPDTTLPVEQREIGGLGIHIVRKMTSELSYRYDGGKNILTAVFNLK